MKKVLLTIFCFTFLFTSCEVDEGLNRDTKNPVSVPGDGLFTNATRNFFDLMQSASVNFNVFRLYAQYWAQTTYPDESQYNQTGRNIPGNIWDTIYRDVLQDLKGARETLIANDADDLENKLAIIDFMEVYAYSVLVDTFGDVPYTEALDPTNPSPKYDDAATIYSDLLSRLDEDIAAMGDGSGFDALQDPVYGGNVSQWKKAANSLRLRLGMRLADVNPSLAQSTAEKAINEDLITDNSDNFGIDYLSGAPNTNPLWVQLVQSGRNDFVAADTFLDVLVDLDDPRLPIFFNEVAGEGYVGGVYGSANSASGSSNLGDILKDPTLDGNIITSAEVHFLLAEAAERGYSTPMTAEEYYNGGVTQSILEWGGTEEQAAEYLAQPEVAYDPANWESKIATQKWIALFNNGFEGWTLWRLFGLPELNAPEGMTLADIPTRFLYPIAEQTLNGSQYDAAASAIGGDEKTTKIFWDVD